MTHRRRVAITGIGLLTPVGNNIGETWSSLVEGKGGVGRITKFDPASLAVQIAAEVKGFSVDAILSSKEQRKMGTFIQYGIAASMAAIRDAGFEIPFVDANPLSGHRPHRIGVSVSAGIGGLPEIEHWVLELQQKEKKVTSPFFVPMIIPNMISGHVSMMTQAKGPNTCIATACASSTHAVGEGFRLIQDHRADVMIVGGAEAVICELGIAGFASMRALSQRNQDPATASRPFDAGRDGFVLGEGAGVLVLEEWDLARKRGARIYAEVLGYGLNADAFHMTSPAPEGAGAQACMRLALEDARLNPEQIQYINTHGTSTPTGDVLEAQAIAQVFASATDLHISSTKSMTGHLLGAAGGVEAAISALALHHQIVPPTINLDTLDPECAALGLNFTPNAAVRKPLQHVLSNSFGFGGTNGSLIFGKA